MIRQALGIGKAGTALPPAAASVQASQPIALERTPETYLGYGRGERFSSNESPATDTSASYSLPATGLDLNRWAFASTWTIGKDASVGENGSSLTLRFRAAKVYLVVNPLAAGPVEARVSVDGLPVSGGDVRGGLLKLDEDRLYTLLDGTVSTDGRILVEFKGRVAVFAFTFG